MGYHMRFVTSLLVAVTLLIPRAHADMPVLPPHTFKVAVMCTDDANCEQGLRSLHNAGVYLHKRVNVTLQLVKVVKSDEVMSGGFFERMAKWRFRSIANKATDGADMTLYFSAPFPSGVNFFDFQEEGVIGMASEIGVLGKLPCFAFVKIMGSDQFSSRIVIHEIGHLLGAHHTNAGLMHPNAGVNQYSDEFSLESLKEIVEHLASL